MSHDPGDVETVARRFWRYVVPDTNGGCWLWTAALSDGGYGRLEVSHRNVPAHRLSWEMHNGPIPSDLFVLHRCDVRACVNPSHLFLGTLKDNTQDCVRKGRFNKKKNAAARENQRVATLRAYAEGREKHFGERNVSATLTEAQAMAIRQSAEPPRVLVAKFNVGLSQIWNIRTGRAWPHLPAPPPTGDGNG